MHYVFKTTTGNFVGTRQETGNLYEKRPTLVGDIAEARVFNTKAAGTNAGKAANVQGKSIPVSIVEA